MTSGYLTEYSIAYNKYCTDWIEVDTDTTYRFRQYTVLHRSNRNIYVEPDNRDYWGNYYIGVRTTTYVGWPSDGQYIFSLSPSYLTTQTSLMPVASRVMHYANTFGYPNDSGKNMYIVADPGEPSAEDICCGDASDSRFYSMNYDNGGSYHYKVCAADSSAAIPKFMAAHEMGHAVAHMNGGPALNGDWEGDEGVFEPSTELCRCDHIELGEAHCAQSREFVGRAASEGYAHFFSSRVFNNQETDGYFNYYKTIRMPPNPPIHYFVWDDDPPNWLDISDNETWMEDKCDPSDDGNSDVGSEWDWLQFFWHLHAHGGSYNWTMSEIANVWDDTSETEKCCHVSSTPPVCFPGGLCAYLGSSYELWNVGETWDDLYAATADDGFPTDKRTRFMNEGGNAGVNY